MIPLSGIISEHILIATLINNALLTFVIILCDGMDGSLLARTINM